MTPKLLTLEKDLAVMTHSCSPSKRIFAKAALAVAFLSTQLFSQSICDGTAGNLVTNCGFETGTTSGWTVSGSTSLSGVTTLSPNSGTYNYQIGSNALNILSQNIATTPGATYRFSFFQRAHEGDDGPNNQLTAYWNGLPVFAEVNANHAFIQRTFTVTATAATTQIRFEGANPTDYSFLDDVIVLTPDLTVTKSHTGNFFQGQLGATYSILVRNIGGLATTGTISLTDTLPAGLTATAISGAGWTCTLATLTCTTATSAAANGGTLPVITVTVNVDPTAPATVTNSATVSGGGESNPANNTSADPTTITGVDFFQIRYAANLTSGDSVINLTNTGANGASLTGPGFGGATGNICANVYAFSPDEQLVSCCSCLITPNGLVSLSVNNDLVSNTLTGVRPNSIVVKVVNTGATGAFNSTSCTNSAAMAGQAAFPLAGGFQAFGTTVHAGAAAGSFGITETPFLRSTLSPTELASITSRCTNIIGDGSSFGICRSCRAGGLTSARN